MKHNLTTGFLEFDHEELQALDKAERILNAAAAAEGPSFQHVAATECNAASLKILRAQIAVHEQVRREVT